MTPTNAGFEGTTAHFNVRNRGDLKAEDVRFTTKASTLCAFAMGWNTKEIVFGALAPRRGLYPGKIQLVELLGHQGKLQWTHGDDGLHIQTPEQKPCDHVVAFKIT